MNQFAVTLFVILIPGIIAAVICDKITVHSKWDSFKFSLYALMLGLFAYVGLQIIYYVWDILKFSQSESSTIANWSHMQIWSSTLSDNPEVPPHEVVIATALSLPVAFLASFVINHKVFNKVAKKLNVSSKYGDENLYSYYLNAKEIDWIYVRDVDNNLTYEGRVDSYAENDTMQELVLYDVTIYRYEDSAKLYSVPTIYLNRELGGFIIEAIPINILGQANEEKKPSD